MIYYTALYTPDASETKYLISCKNQTGSLVWYLVAGSWTGQWWLLCTRPSFISRLQRPSRPAEDEQCNQWINFSSSTFNWFLCLTLTGDEGGGCMLQSRVRSNNKYFLSHWGSLLCSVVKLTKNWWSKCDKMCNNYKKCPNSARKTDNMLGMALHGKNSCLHHKKT